jgi:hypothetical protein
VVDVSEWVLDLLFRRPNPPLPPDQEEAVDRLEAEAEGVFANFRRNRRRLAEDARQLFQLLGKIPEEIRWNQGLRQSLHGLVLAAVEQAERFGDGQGENKRKFATTLLVRVVQNYNVGGLPFLPIIERAVIAPIAGIVIDWSVEVLNLNPDLWPAVEHTGFPHRMIDTYGRVIRWALWLAGIFLQLHKLFHFTRYEREVRDALQAMDLEVLTLLRVLPPDQLHPIFDELATTLDDIGHKTLPFVRLAHDVLRLAAEFTELSPAARTEAVFRMIRDLIREIYANDPFALAFIDSPLGTLLLRTIVEHTEWVLARHGLLPGRQLLLPPPASTAAAT